MTVSIEMVAPGLVGVWIDHKLNTVVLFTMIGFTIGITAAIWHLVKMTRDDEPDSPDSSSKTTRRDAEVDEIDGEGKL